MTRIFATLSVISLALLASTLVVGLGIGDAALRSDEPSQRWMTAHFLLGTGSALVVVLVHSIVVTYFVGTSRWCKEVAETYQLDRGLIQQSQQIKRGAFPWALSGMLAIVAVIALGAASDPATGFDREATQMSSQLHLVAAFLGLAFIGMTYYMAWSRIWSNQQLVNRVLDEVQRIRREKGLD